MTAHPLAGHFSVDASARRIRHYRYVEERMMRALGGWIALTPELPVKLLFGRHVWDCAQHADLWGRRLPELRAAAQQSEPANEAVVAFMEVLESAERPDQSVERVAGVYRVLKPHLLATYEAHLAVANPVYEPPTRRILERAIAEERRHVAAGGIALARLLAGDGAGGRVAAWEGRLRGALAEAGGLAGDTPEPPFALEGSGADPQRDLVALDSRFDPVVVAPDLRADVEAHAAALVTGDSIGVARHVAPHARDTVLRAYAGLSPAALWAIVAQAKVGAHRLIKLRLSGPEGARVLQQQWRRFDDGWRVVEAEIVSAAPAP
ncbi:MAG: hypothetical protein ACREM3_19795 [Candidatus Rokuibacteriota bacterium]